MQRSLLSSRGAGYGRRAVLGGAGRIAVGALMGSQAFAPRGAGAASAANVLFTSAGYACKAAALTRALMRGSAWAAAHPAETAQLEVAGKHVPATLADNRTALGMIAFVPSVAGAQANTGDVLARMVRLGFLDPGTDVPALLSRMFVPVTAELAAQVPARTQLPRTGGAPLGVPLSAGLAPAGPARARRRPLHRRTRRGRRARASGPRSLTRATAPPAGRFAAAGPWSRARAPSASAGRRWGADSHLAPSGRAGRRRKLVGLFPDLGLRAAAVAWPTRSGAWAASPAVAIASGACSATSTGARAGADAAGPRGRSPEPDGPVSPWRGPRRRRRSRTAMSKRPRAPRASEQRGSRHSPA